MAETWLLRLYENAQDGQRPGDSGWIRVCEAGGGDWLLEGVWSLSGEMKCPEVRWGCEDTKIQRIVHFRSVGFMICGFYFNNATRKRKERIPMGGSEVRSRPIHFVKVTGREQMGVVRGGVFRASSGGGGQAAGRWWGTEEGEPQAKLLGREAGRGEEGPDAHTGLRSPLLPWRGEVPRPSVQQGPGGNTERPCVLGGFVGICCC